jgi:histone-binding protein RBBP4
MDPSLQKTLMDMANGLEDAVKNGTLPPGAEALLNVLEGNGDDNDNEDDNSDVNGNDDSNGNGEGEETEQTILEEYKLWRKNCRYMYSFVSETALTWPSLSVQFFKADTFVNKTKDTKYGVTRNLLITTHTSGEDEDFLKVATLQLPRSLTENATLTPEELETVNSRLKISKKYPQSVEVNKVRLNPYDNRVWASINANGEVVVYETDEKMNPTAEIKLEHHTQNGFGLSWDPNQATTLITGAEDSTIAIWDYKKQTTPLTVIRDHTNFVNDVRFSYKKDGVFASVGEDKLLLLGDRSGKVNARHHSKLKTTINTLTFSPHSENLLLLGGEDSNNYVYDLRQMEAPLHTLVGHGKSITNVEWDPFHENIVASSSMDRRVILWDLTKIGEEQLQEEAEDGVPELVMMHGGHTGGVNDFAFSPDTPWCIASCSDDNIVHVWAAKEEVVVPVATTVADNVLE